MAQDFLYLNRVQNSYFCICVCILYLLWNTVYLHFESNVLLYWYIMRVKLRPLPWRGVPSADGPASRPPWRQVRTPRSVGCWGCEPPAVGEGRRCCREPGSRGRAMWGWIVPQYALRCCPWSLCWGGCRNDLPPKHDIRGRKESHSGVKSINNNFCDGPE